MKVEGDKMFLSLRKKNFFAVFTILILVVTFCIGFFEMNKSYAQYDSKDDFVQFESEYINLLRKDKENNVQSNSRSFSNDEESVFALKRLIVIGNLENDYGASMVIDGYKNYYILCYNSEQETEFAYNQLSKNENLYVIIDQKIYASDYADNDYSYSDYDSWGAEAMDVGGINDYLETFGTKEDVVVAVLDTGIDTEHTYFENRLIVNDGVIEGFSYIETSDVNYAFEDDNGHGTHVAGIITQITPENVKILPIKVLDSSGEGGLGSIIFALTRILEEYSSVYNVCCVNMSLSAEIGQPYQRMDVVIDELKGNNILTVVSAGNDKLDSKYYSPANSDSAITVSAIVKGNGVYEFDKSYSNFGSYVDISAPGSNILSANYNVNDGSVSKSGTSMAAPHVSGAVALLCCMGEYWQGSTPIYTADEIEGRLYENTIDLGEEGKDDFYGYGMVNFKYFNIPSSQDVLTFKDGNGKVLDVSNYIEFEDVLTLTIESPNSNYQIFYTDDYTIPAKDSTRYISSLTVSHSTIYYFIGLEIVDGQTISSSDLYIVDLFNPNDSIDDFFVNDNGVLTDYTGHFKNLELPSTIDGRYYTDLEARLFNNNEIETLVLPSNCLKIREYCFSNCKNLKSVKFNSVDNIGCYAFENCESLTDICLDSVVYLGSNTFFYDMLGHSFAGCTGLTEIYLPNVVNIGEYAFTDTNVTMVAIGDSFAVADGVSIDQEITIYGYEGTLAEEYCNSYGNTFVPIEEFAIENDLEEAKDVKQGTVDNLQINVNGLRLKYQWFTTSGSILNGVSLSGETEQTLNLNTSTLGSKKYFVRITDWEGNVLNSSICTVNVVINEDMYIAQIYSQTGWEYYTSLSSAVFDSEDGDVIVITNDCYLYENIIINKNLTLISTNNSTIYIDEILSNSSSPIISVTERGSLTIGYTSNTYQGLNVTDIYIDGQNEKLNTFVSLSTNSSLYLKELSQIQNICADKIVDGENQSSLYIQGGEIVDCQSNFTNNDNYLFYASNVTIESNSTLSNIIVDGGGIIYANNSNLTILGAIFSENSANYLFFTGHDAQINLHGVIFKDNICNALIYYDIANDSKSLLQIESAQAQNNYSKNQKYYDVYINDSVTVSADTQNRIQIGGECDFTSYYLNNKNTFFTLTFTDNLPSDRQITIDVLNESNYNDNPIIIFESGLTFDPNNFYNQNNTFIAKVQENGQNYLYLQERTYKFTFVINQDESVVHYYTAGQPIEIIDEPSQIGYDFLGWFSDEEGLYEYNFSTMPKEDVTVYAKWKLQTFTIKATSEGGGEISPSGDIDVNYGDSKQFLFEANEGYFVNSIIVDGVELSSEELENAVVNGYIFQDISGNHEINVTFKIYTYYIISNANDFGQISPKGNMTYEYGQDAVYYLSANYGYHLEELYVDTLKIDESQYQNILENGYTFNDINQPHTINAVFAVNLYTIDTQADEHCQIWSNEEGDIEHGQNRTYFVGVDVGYKINKIIVDGKELTPEQVENVIQNGYTFDSVEEKHTIEVESLVKQYDIVYHLVYNDETLTLTYDYNSTINEYLPTRTGYDFIGWYLDGDLTDEFNLSAMPAEDLDLYAKWEIKYFTITASSNGNGEISPSGQTQRRYNTSIHYSFIVDEGNYISSIIVDGQELAGQELTDAKNNGYTFENIDSNHEIFVDFEAYKFSIRLSVEGNGRFYCEEDITNIDYGDERTFIIDVDFDSYDVEIYVNGRLIDNENGQSLQVYNINQNMSIGVRFIQKPFVETETGKIVLIVAGTIAGIALVSVVIVAIVKRRRLYSDIDKY